MKYDLILIDFFLTSVCTSAAILANVSLAIYFPDQCHTSKDISPHFASDLSADYLADTGTVYGHQGFPVGNLDTAHSHNFLLYAILIHSLCTMLRRLPGLFLVDLMAEF